MFGLKTNALLVIAVLAVASVAMGQPSANSIVVTPISASTSEALTFNNEVLDGSLTIDGSGLSMVVSAGDPASSVASVTHNGYDNRTKDFQGWNTLSTGSGVGATITLGLGASMDAIEGIWVWNGISVGVKGRAVASFSAEVSSDGTNFTNIGTYNLTDVAPADASPAEFIAFATLQDSVQAIKLTITSLHASHSTTPLDYAGIREIRVSQVVPEPMTMSLLAVGGVALLRRRRA